MFDLRQGVRRQEYGSALLSDFFEQAVEQGKTASVVDLLVRPPIAFFRNYVVRGGIKDGKVGLVVSLLNSYYVFLKFAKLWERRHRTRNL